MNWLVKLVGQLLRWFGFKPRLRIRHVDSMRSLPADLSSNLLYLVGDKLAPKWVVLACPCSCGERIDVNLMAARKPVWRLTQSHGKVTLFPSLWVPETKCGSHFWIINSRVEWHVAPFGSSSHGEPGLTSTRY
jgi:uncharacterized protein DUF6527